MTVAQQRLSERQLQDLVLALCGALRLYAYHTYDSRGCAPGFPDLVIVGKRVLWRELKSTRGQLTRDQTQVLAGLVQAGQDAGIWRPVDWFSGRIQTQLMAVRQRNSPKNGVITRATQNAGQRRSAAAVRRAHRSGATKAATSPA